VGPLQAREGRISGRDNILIIKGLSLNIASYGSLIT
jgi:hypothetical protein